MDILKAEGLSISFGNKNIIKQLDLTIKKGKIVTIIGPNGSGKTTLLRALCRNLRLQQGTVFLNGKNIFKMNTKAVARELAIMTQNHSSTGDIIVKDLVKYGRFAHKNFLKSQTEEDEKAVEWALKKTGMEEFSERIVDTLSGGETQRAWLAMALSQKPKVLILDEPTTFLDICYQIEILELVHSLNREEGITIIMVLHDINQAAKYSDEIVVIREGKIYEKGSPLDVVNEKTMKEVFRVRGIITIDEEINKPVFFIKGRWEDKYEHNNSDNIKSCNF